MGTGGFLETLMQKKKDFKKITTGIENTFFSK